MSLHGTNAKCQPHRGMSEFGGEAENICSHRVFRILTRSGHRAGAQHSCCKIVGPADDHAVHCNRPGLRFSSHRWQLIPRVRSRSRRRDGPRSAILSARNLRPLPSAADDLPQPHERGLSWCWPAFSEELQHRLSNRGWLLQEHEVTSPWHIDEPHPFSQALA
jgi:hypothetical protein